jgi:hypothetical protein
MGPAHLDMIVGTVEAVNERGVRIAGEWYNFSKFSTVDPPAVGNYVRLGVDNKGFIMSVAEHDDEPVQIGIGSDRAVRLAVLEAAAQFAADRDEIKSADVLRIAESWLAWVER